MSAIFKSTVLPVTKEEGVNDLPMAVRAPFAKALVAERNGGSFPNKDGEELTAEQWLALAIAAA